MHDDGGVTARGPGIRATPWTIRPYQVDDEPAVIALHTRGFGQPWSAERWHWRCLATPLRRPQAMGAFDRNGRCGALFVGVPLPCRYRGDPGIAISGSNSLLDPVLRRSLAGARLFRQVVLHFFDHFGGDEARMMYGSPIQPLVRTMVAHMRVEVLADVHGLVREVGDGHATGATAAAAVSALPADTDQLWARCAAGQPTGLVRDRAFLDWRFARHPLTRYLYLAVRDGTGMLRGLAVLRVGGWHDDVMSIAEWLVPDGDVAAETALLAGADNLARRHACQRLVAVWSANTPEHRRWQTTHRFFVHPTSHQLVFRSFAHDVDRQFLFDHWRLTMADLEFL